MKVGYIRVSTKDQNEDRQIKALTEYGVEKFFGIGEKLSGKDTNRADLQAMMQFVREGDTIVIESISRLARNTLDFLTLVKDLTERKIDIISLKEKIDTTTIQGKFMLTVFGALYEMERETIRQRQQEGIVVALERGVRFGRPKVQASEEFKRTYKEWKEQKLTAREAMKRLNMKPNTFYRRVKEMEG